MKFYCTKCKKIKDGRQVIRKLFCYICRECRRIVEKKK